MSSRALRRAQKELEERQQLEKLTQPDEEEESEEEASPVSKPKASLFAMLGEAEQGDGEDFEVDENASDEGDKPEAVVPPTSSASKKSKKKKKKGKGKAKAKVPEKPVASFSDIGSGLDEIDQALLALNLSSQSKSEHDHDQLTSTISEELQQLYSVLAVDTQYLQASNEMRKLFGRAAVQGNNEGEAAGGRRRGRGQHQGGIVGVPGNRNLASLGLRRNIFLPRKEEWPRATSGGLGMEIVETRSDGTIEYRFVHNTTYQSVQNQFEICVASMDPERMVQLLHFNPYHISTLLQVSEIAKQQRDNAAAGDMLERALFSFGRAVHSTFANSLSQGKARLNFRRPENRELWLAVFRYISLLGARATWRTAFEWAKLLLSMDPEGDPYCIRLLIDQLALRGRQAQSLVDLVETDYLQRLWKIPPNLAISVALAHDHLKNPEKARSALRLAIREYPWVAARLCKELEISPIPHPIWGKEPNDHSQELLCQLYVKNAKDLWNTPESTSLLVEVASSFEDVLDAGENPYWLERIDEVKVARHVILSDDRTLITLLNPSVTAKYASASDPLPPEDSIASYTLTASRHQDVQGFNEDQIYAELQRLQAYFRNIDLGRGIEAGGITQEELRRLLEESGTNLDEFRRDMERFQFLRLRAQERGLQVEFDREGEENTDSGSDV
ncbi:DUF654-domain-containing protein [Zopfia rhizophila CBS 207.26]|uniref:DUF654-domain-containing protein n=1 Tax=Zopfia rhizophila CBS 207.26 TaxID=1314779 RepID=A0A6A6E321_9PEZI|nr:DUF654-domain-containing protein [Zopfia rhizophila CBS 207.26]